MKICNVENCNRNVWSKGKCSLHQEKKPLSSGKGLTRKMSVIPNKKAKNEHNDGHIIQMGKGIYQQVREGKVTNFDFINNNKLKEFFELCWKNKPHYCEVSGKFLGNICSSLYQHHILPKSKYPEACFDEENIVFLHPEIHASVELDMYKYEYINKKRELLKIKYSII